MSKHPISGGTIGPEIKTNTCKVGSWWGGKLLEPRPIPSQHAAFLRAANRWLCGETDGTETYRDKT